MAMRLASVNASFNFVVFERVSNKPWNVYKDQSADSLTGWMERSENTQTARRAARLVRIRRRY